MKKTVGIVLLTGVLAACNFNQSVNKDLTTDAYSRGNGIGCSSVDMQINGAKEKRNVFIYGEKVFFTFNDVTGLTKKGGKFFPGLSLVIIKNGKDTVVAHADLLAELKQGTDLQPLQLQANFLSNLPFENQEKYKVCLKIWDKKGKGTFTYEMPFTVQENKLLQIKSMGLDYKEIYLWNESLKQVVTDKNLNTKNAYILILQGLSGMNDADGNVYPVFSIELTDRKGNKILSNPNVLEQYATSGVLSESVANGQLATIITFTPGQINNPCILRASITDKKSNKRIDIRSEVSIR
jgi:hypothetical protein